MKFHKLLRVALFVFVLAAAIAPGIFTSTVEGNSTTGLSAPKPPAAVDARAVAEQHVRENLNSLGLVESDISDWIISDRYTTKHNGVTHIYYTQRLDGIRVLNGILNVNVTREGRVLSVGNRFIPRLAEVAGARSPQLTAEQAVRAAAAHLKLLSVPALPLVVKQFIGGPEQQVVFAAAPLSRSPIRARLQYLPVERGARLVWDVEIQPDSNHYWHVEVDAVDASVIRKFNLVKNDSYKVYAWPAESPNHVRNLPLPPADGRTVVNGSFANSTASPFGWHDTNGAVGADTTDTTGNNVEAQTDLDADDTYTSLTEVRPSNPLRDFIYPIDLTQEPTTYREAVVTNLFYWNNVVHDIHYLYGFDEAAGNFQQNNYGRGGLGNDRVVADAQDGSGKNNANFLTLPDGTPAGPSSGSRMQMFLWAGEPILRVNSPAQIAGDYKAAAAAFGAALDSSGVTGNLQVINSPLNPQGELPSQGCYPAPGTLTGKIAVIDRGGCEFGQKVVSAEQSGAIAAIVVNNAGDELVFMGPGNTGAAATIPSIFIGQTNGTTIKNTIAATTVNATMKKAAVDRDSDLDSGVIIHEYTHGVSTRLTGGPSNVLCLENLEQGGEGWSDWFALAMTARTGDKGTDARGIGTYVTFQDPPTFGGGIRLYPYSTDMTINPQTYESLKDPEVAVPHGVGAVWAEMLWEMYWNIVDGVPDLNLPGRGYRQNIYDLSQPLAGNQIAMRLVMDGLKIQPCMPTFVEARDAILEADRVNNGGAFHCHIWKAFAKRGLGVNAQDGGKYPLDDQTAVVEDFSLPCECSLPSLTNYAAASNGATATASSFYPDRNYMPSGAINGDHLGLNWENNGGWNDATRDVWPDWLEVSFNGSKTINQIRVYSVQDNFTNPVEPNFAMTTLYGLQDFEVQYWDTSTSQWVAVPNGQITNNNLVMNVLVFNEVTTPKIRVYVTNAHSHFSRIVEVEAYGCSTP